MHARIPFAVSMSVALALGLAPSAGASCKEAHLLRSPGLVKIEGSCFKYCVANAPNFSSRADALFWALGSGDPVVGRGNDSGAFASSFFIRGRLPYNYGNGTFYNYERTLETNWGAHFLIDGCVMEEGPGACTCLLLSDEFDGSGYFAILSAQADRYLHFDFGRGGVTLGRLPAPTVAASSRTSSGLDVEVVVDAPEKGVQLSPGGLCDCGPVGFRVVARVEPAGAPPPLSRTAVGWKVPVLAGGNRQSNTPFGRPARVAVDCDAPDATVHLGAVLVFEDGFTTPVVSALAGPLTCGRPPAG